MSNPNIISAVKAFILDKDGNFLCLYRSDTHPTHPHWADIPGGLIDENEQPIEALIREVQEECRYSILKSRKKLIFGSSEVPKKFSGTSITRLFYVVQIEETQPVLTISWEHEKYEWLPFEQIYNIQFEEFVEDAKKYILQNKISLNA